MLKQPFAIITCVFLCAWQFGCRADAESDGTREMLIHGEPVPEKIRQRLDAAGWHERVGDGLGLWVSVSRQQLAGIEKGRICFIYACSTAAKGTGNQENTNQTPLGWHKIAERYGEGLPWGAIFQERNYTGEVWNPTDETTKDFILSRILWLRGLEPGVNQGPGVDSHARYIYIHGTPAERSLGTPRSLGCVRLSNDDVIALFDVASSGTKVLITQW